MTINRIACGLLGGALVSIVAAPARGWETYRDFSTGDFKRCADKPTRRAGDRAKWDSYVAVFAVTRALQPYEQVLVVSRLRTENLHASRQATLVKSFIQVERPNGDQAASAKAGQNNTGTLDLQNAIVFRNPSDTASPFTFKLMMLTSNQPNIAGAKASYAACTDVTGSQRGVRILDASHLKIKSHTAATISLKASSGASGSFQLHQGDDTPRDALRGAEAVRVGLSGKVRFKAYAQVTFCYTNKPEHRCGPGYDLPSAKVRMRLIARTMPPGAAAFGEPFAVGARTAVISRATHHKMIYMNRNLRLAPDTLVETWLELKNVGRGPLDIDLMGGGEGAAPHAQIIAYSH